jgi:hypothetical protein
MTQKAPPPTATTAQLAALAGIPMRSVEPILRAAGVTPLSQTTRKNGAVVRAWPREASLKAIAESDEAIVKTFRDATSIARAKILDLGEGLRAGTHVRVRDTLAWLAAYTAASNNALRSAPAAFHAPLAEVNSRALPEPERRAAARAVLESLIERVHKLSEAPLPWQQ